MEKSAGKLGSIKLLCCTAKSYICMEPKGTDKVWPLVAEVTEKKCKDHADIAKHTFPAPREVRHQQR